jgi:hypothetical protein
VACFVLFVWMCRKGGVLYTTASLLSLTEETEDEAGEEETIGRYGLRLIRKKGAANVHVLQVAVTDMIIRWSGV